MKYKLGQEVGQELWFVTEKVSLSLFFCNFPFVGHHKWWGRRSWGLWRSNNYVAEWLSWAATVLKISSRVDPWPRHPLANSVYSQLTRKLNQITINFVPSSSLKVLAASRDSEKASWDWGKERVILWFSWFINDSEMKPQKERGNCGTFFLEKRGDRTPTSCLRKIAEVTNRFLLILK